MNNKIFHHHAEEPRAFVLEEYDASTGETTFRLGCERGLSVKRWKTLKGAMKNLEIHVIKRFYS